MAPSRLIPTAPAVGARRPAVGEAVHLRLPCFEFGDASFASPADAFWAWRDAFSVLFDVAVSTPQALASFQGSIVGYHFGQMLVGIWQSSDQIQRRSNTTIARSGIDHIMLRCLRTGRCEGKADGLAFRLDAGQVGVFDLARPISLSCHEVDNIVLVLPRSLFAARRAALDEAHGMVLSGPLSAVLARYMYSLIEQAPAFGPADGLALTEPTVALVSACVHELPESRREGRAVTLMAVKRYLDEHLADPDLRAEAACHRFGLSRPTLYRLFEPYGGFLRYLQDRRLKRCFNDLVSSNANPRRIADIADSWGFQSAAVFSRAFRRVYGVSARDARLAASTGFALGADGQTGISGWIHSLKRL